MSCNKVHIEPIGCCPFNGELTVECLRVKRVNKGALKTVRGSSIPALSGLSLKAAFARFLAWNDLAAERR